MDIIWRIFLACILFEIASIPIVIFTATWIIGTWFDYKLKYTGKVLIAAGEEMKKQHRLREDKKDNG